VSDTLGRMWKEAAMIQGSEKSHGKPRVLIIGP